jgi:hypothetical protein
VLDHAQRGPRLIFSCGWHISFDGKDVYPRAMQREEKIARLLGKLTRVGDPILEINLTRRVDYALFMVTILENDALIHEAAAIVGCQIPSAMACQASG